MRSSWRASTQVPSACPCGLKSHGCGFRVFNTYSSIPPRIVTRRGLNRLIEYIAPREHHSWLDRGRLFTVSRFKITHRATRFGLSWLPRTRSCHPAPPRGALQLSTIDPGGSQRGKCPLSLVLACLGPAERQRCRYFVPGGAAVGYISRVQGYLKVLISHSQNDLQSRI